MPGAVKCVLFDLDGTLIDTAPQMAAVLNDLRRDSGRDELPYHRILPYVSRGAAELIRLGFGDTPESEELRLAFLDNYMDTVTQSMPFQGIPELLTELDESGIAWGIVTNKPERFALPLLQALQLSERSAITVCGDTLKESKPHPAPLLHAARETHTSPDNCIMVGDDLNDILAAKSAGITSVIAAYGYIPSHDEICNWQAEHTVQHPADIKPLCRINNE